MCGIVAYIGDRQAYPIVLSGLKRLEYRGYDSAGVAVLKNGNINVYKKEGKVSNLEDFVKEKDISGTIAIGHTRWATHGPPNDVNAHPHTSENGNITDYPLLTSVNSNTWYTLRIQIDRSQGKISYLIDGVEYDSSPIMTPSIVETAPTSYISLSSKLSYRSAHSST